MPMEGEIQNMKMASGVGLIKAKVCLIFIPTSTRTNSHEIAYTLQ